MSFIPKKKRFKFNVSFEVEELCQIPLVSGVLFVKVRQVDGGNYTQYSDRKPVTDHRVCWDKKHDFVCKMAGSATSGVLETCLCRVSVRKELKGGKAWQKLGYADINLSEFAGSGITARRYLLQGYDHKKQLGNSTLKVCIHMSLLSGDPCFKAPRPSDPQDNMEDVEELGLQPENKGASDDTSGDSVASGSSGFGSLPRKPETMQVCPDPQGEGEGAQAPPASLAVSGAVCEGSPYAGHCRNASNVSKVSGYCSAATATHSRQSSLDSNKVHHRTSSVDSSDQSRYGSTGRPKKHEPSSSIERRVGATRVDADTIVDELLQGTDLLVDESAETSGLQLYVAKDGSTALGQGQARSQGVSGKFQPVIIADR